MAFLYKKSLGQNFVYDLAYLRALIAPLGLQANDCVVEVGAGAGTLTQVLAETGAQVISVEIDQRLFAGLQTKFANCSHVHLRFGDALQQDFRALPPFRVIANVPYYITTPLLTKFLSLPNCREIVVMVAQEVAARIVAPVGCAAYGALSVSCQLLATCSIIKQVPRTMFTPVPNVDSAFVRLVRNQTAWQNTFSSFLKGIFAARRKTMLNALTGVLHGDKTAASAYLTQAAIAFDLRPEQVPPTAYAKLYAIMSSADTKVGLGSRHDRTH